MKCILRLYGMRGGAPRSILQHIDALKESSFDYCECLTHNSDNQMYLAYEKTVNKMILRLSPDESWRKHKVWRSFNEYRWEYRHIKSVQPDLLIALGQFNGALYSYIGRKLGIPLIIYIAGGVLDDDDPSIKCWKDCETICFSIENADVIERSFPPQHIHIISNRIHITERFDDINTHYQQGVSNIHFLIVSRLDPDKMQSVYSIIRALSQVVGNAYHVEVRIAGNGTCRDELSEFIKPFQSDRMRIKLLGQVHVLTEEFRWAHIVAGKGRSVIEPIMMNRLGCVIGEDGKIEFCSTHNFDNLYHYNFSGRHLCADNPNAELTEMFMRITKENIHETDILDVAQLTSQRYSSEYLLQQLRAVLQKTPAKTPKRWMPLWFGFARLMAKKIHHRVFKKVNKCATNS